MNKKSDVGCGGGGGGDSDGHGDGDIRKRSQPYKKGKVDALYGALEILINAA